VGGTHRINSPAEAPGLLAEAFANYILDARARLA
jgi:hypothetical protein